MVAVQVGDQWNLAGVTIVTNIDVRLDKKCVGASAKDRENCASIPARHQPERKAKHKHSSAPLE